MGRYVNVIWYVNAVDEASNVITSGNNFLIAGTFSSASWIENGPLALARKEIHAVW